MRRDIEGKRSARVPPAVDLADAGAGNEAPRPGVRVPGRIQSLGRMDAILRAIVDSPDGTAKLTELAGSTGLHKSTTFSLLETLVKLGYAARKASGYTLGPRLFELAKQAERRLDLIPLTRPIMYEMVRQSRESVSLAIPASIDAIIISTIEGTFGVRGARWEGRHVHYHASALGKVMLAFMPADAQGSLLGALRLERHTRRTIVTRDGLEAELGKVRQQGFALCMEEEEVGSNSVAAPVLDRMGEVAGAVAVWGPASRLTRSHLVALGATLVGHLSELQR